MRTRRCEVLRALRRAADGGLLIRSQAWPASPERRSSVSSRPIACWKRSRREACAPPAAACRCARSKTGVYEVELDDERRVVVKFYRPDAGHGRRSRMKHASWPISPRRRSPRWRRWIWARGTTLNEIDGILYAAFRRSADGAGELDAENRRRIGRTIGRLHAVGARACTNATGEHRELHSGAARRATVR